MSVLLLSPNPPLTLPPDVVLHRPSRLFASVRLKRLRPTALIAAMPAAQIPGPWPQIGLCRNANDAARYRPGTRLVAGLESLARQLNQQGRAALYLPWPVPEMASPLPEGDPHVLAVAPLVRASGLDVMLKALAGIAGMSVTIAGQGNGRGELLELAKRLRIPLALYDRVSVADYQRATLVLHPVRFDAEGTAIRAAHAAARPLIATATEAARELIQPNETGMLVPPGDGGAIALSVKTLLESPAMAAAMAEAGLERHRAQESEALLAGRWSDYLSQFAPNQEPADE